MGDPTLFYVSIETVFKGWTALQLAVEHSFGGSQSRAKEVWFVGATEQWFKENSGIDSYELEEFLAEIMSSEFNSIVDDNSAAEVATKICRFYDMINQGKAEELCEILSSLKQKSAGVKSSQRGQGNDDDDEDDDMDIEQDNAMSQMNALELSANSQSGTSETTDTADGEVSKSPTEGAGGDNNRLEAEEDDGWTHVTKGGKKKKGPR